MSVIVVATFHVKAAHRTEGARLIEGFIERSLEQRGCLFYDLYQSNDDPCELVIVDGWETQQDLNAHAASEHVHATVEKLTPLLEVPASVKTYRKVS